MSFGHFGIALVDGRTGDDDFRALDVLGTMAFKDLRTKVCKALGDGRGTEVGSGDAVSEIEDDLGDAAHADAADADKVDALDFGEQGSVTSFEFPVSSKTLSATKVEQEAVFSPQRSRGGRGAELFWDYQTGGDGGDLGGGIGVGKILSGLGHLREFAAVGE